MISESTLKFLRDIGKNNNREWFEKNRNRYDSSKTEFESYIAKLIVILAKTDPGISGLAVKDAIYRIYRDVRFSKNKDPYKTSMSASVKPGGRKSPNCGFYFQIDPVGEWGSFLAGGFWMPDALILKKIRQEIEYNTAEFKSILSNKSFRNWFGELEPSKLKRVPKGISPDHPDAELFKYTSFIVSRPLTREEITSAGLVNTCGKAFIAMKPFLDFLNRATQ